MTNKVIVSACLAGMNCRYDGRNKQREDIIELVRRGDAVPVCPEQLGGLSTPREPVETVNGKMLTITGKDVTFEYQKGAQEALHIAELIGAKEALLKSNSPMCGAGAIYDGSFNGSKVNGDGAFTKLLKGLGIKVTSIN